MNDIEDLWDNPQYNTDCFSKENGLPYLLKLIRKGVIKRFDLMITDPPYNIDAGICKGSKYKKKRGDSAKLYNDKMSEYKYRIFSNIWFYYAKKISNRIIFTCGKENAQYWFYLAEINNFKFQLVSWYIPNQSSRGKVSKFIKFEPILCYGDFTKCKLNHDFITAGYIDAYVDSGFLIDKKDHPKHPHPKPMRLYKKILKEIKPKSIIDPFCGSGASIVVAKQLGIPFIAYDKGDYKQDYLDKLKKLKKDNKNRFY